ncbi:hypothetical protein EVG20_g6391 [Dentipellis fragilis]|uniref:F-box domain-containing protein n=1 Tax=Dentipellis fragilis TaxID=205917 RepID=A0A4Y9YQE1_9AGAM|nr:hypothetical protein EVG20_g6391 [Dentipellis fragilis]
MFLRLGPRSFLRKMRSIMNQLEACTFLEMPVEILILILRELDYKMLLRCSMTCKRLRSLVNNVSELQYTVVLAAEGVLDEFPDAFGTDGRLQRLIDRRERWRVPDWENRRLLRLPLNSATSFSDPSSHITFTNGVFVNTSYNQQRFIAAITVLFPPTPGSVALFSIHVNDFSLPENTLLDNYLPPPFHDLNLDPVQQILVHPKLDLLVLLKISRQVPNQVSYDLHIRSLKSAARRAHPQCTYAVLHNTFEQSSGRLRPLVRGLEDRVALHVCHNGDGRICVWNWVTGHKIVEVQDVFTSVCLYDFALISPDVLVAAVSSGSFNPDTRTPRSATIWVYDLKILPHGFDDSSKPMVCPLILCFPTFRDGKVVIHSFKCISDHLSGHAQLDARSWAMPRAVAFHLETSYGWTLLVVRADTFGSLLQASSQSQSMITLPWQKWGPANTRLFEPKTAYWGELGMMGNGRLVVEPHPSLLGDRPVELLDFHVGRYKPQELVTKPSTVRSDVFKHSVTTRLPYHVIPVYGVEWPAEFMLHEKYLIGCRYKHGPNPFAEVEILEL